MVFVVMCFFTISALTSLSTNIWLSKWTDQAKKSTITMNGTSVPINQMHGLSIYSALGICQGKKFKRKKKSSYIY